MKLYEIIGQPATSDGSVHYDPEQKRIRFSGDKPKLTLKSLKRIRLMKDAHKKKSAAKSALIGLMYSQDDIQSNKLETELSPSAAEQHLTKLAMSHITRSQMGD
ncbi:hypothetical protein MTBPR1_220006 [Candidatus Terasakiella magnetica]|uniref:Uncharacterized protein n=1 Tax=Candidatus Terasakiella magnetica TaxID=1867952 RepID=A0A1C3RGZ9_9PROT|nr:hypothetical protein [Candidatus Terasakiella magnetica]SCA56573.1 hypothetical protein MTBPR1_220006 [Candidatus Terasakiella magnetica]